jgi:hypothetical protein
MHVIHKFGSSHNPLLAVFCGKSQSIEAVTPSCGKAFAGTWVGSSTMLLLLLLLLLLMLPLPTLMLLLLWLLLSLCCISHRQSCLFTDRAHPAAFGNAAEIWL